MTLSLTDRAAIEGLMDAVSMEASPELRSSIEEVRVQLRNGELLERLGELRGLSGN